MNKNLNLNFGHDTNLTTFDILLDPVFSIEVEELYLHDAIVTSIVC